MIYWIGLCFFTFYIVGLSLAEKGSFNGGGGGNGHTTNPHHRAIRNNTISGLGRGCRHKSEYFVNPHVRFPMCMGQTDADLKNGMSIINLINSRGFLPTCRILHLLLWMASETQEKHITSNDYFIDVGANIGKTSDLPTSSSLTIDKLILCCFVLIQVPVLFTWQH